MKKNEIVIERKSLYRTLVKVALPIALQSLIASSLNLVDSLMVGNLGETELAAVGLSTQIFFLYWGVLFGFASGASAFMAQFWGKQDLVGIRKVTGFAITLCTSVGLVFFLAAVFLPEDLLRVFTNIPETIQIGAGFLQVASVSFLTLGITIPLTAALRGTQQTSLPLKISAVAFSTNTALNYLLIYGKLGMPQMGVMGAGLATSIARVLELMLVLYFVFGRKNRISGSVADFFQWKTSFVTKILMTAVPVMINEAMWSLGMATYNAAYGRMGITEFAAVQAATTLNTLFIMVVFSLGDAMVILVGQRIGMGEKEYAYALGKRLLSIGIFVGACSGALMILVSQFVIKWFHFTELGQSYALIVVGIYGLFMPLKIFNGLNIVGILRCGGDTKYAMWLEIGSVWFIGVPAVFFGALWLNLPIYWVVLMAQGEELFKGVFCYYRFKSRKWLNNLVEDM